MRLADHFLAARGTYADLGGFATHMGPRIERAQIFEVSDEVVRAAGGLIQSRPSTLVAALPLCRMPYETMWLEYRGGLGPQQGGRTEFDGAPVPWKQGVLVEAMAGGQAGLLTIAWMHSPDSSTEGITRHPINITPVSVYFDWRPDGDVREMVKLAHATFLRSIEYQPGLHKTIALYIDYLEKKWMDWATKESVRADAVRAVFAGQSAWKNFSDDPREAEGMQTLYRHMMPGLCPHGIGLVATVMAKLGTSATEMDKLMMMFEADMNGEGGWTQCFIAMCNSRNPVVENTPVDLTKLNKARRKSGKPQFLPYNKTRLAMSRSQERIAHAHGVDREAARQHLVRGHFKIRRTGVYWWSPFLRGDASRGTKPRESYDVQLGRSPQ
jgi:hypothetical protein